MENIITSLRLRKIGILSCVFLPLCLNSLSAKGYRGDIQANSFMLHYQNQEATLNHQETSPDSGYTALDEEVTTTINSIQLEASREFFASYLFSFTLSARYGKNFGSSENTNQATGYSHKEKVSGEIYGGGASLNLNFSAYGLKVQPFLAAYSFTHSNSYELSYHLEGDSSNATEFKYESEDQTLQYSLGVRFIDYFKGLMSYFSLDYISADDPTINSSSNLNEFSNPSTPDRRDYAFTIGFGVLF